MQTMIGERWERAQLAAHSLAHVNRQLCMTLIDNYSDLELSLIQTENADFPSHFDPRFRILEDRFFAPLASEHVVEVRHRFPPRLTEPESKYIWMQPWEYGSLPRHWARHILANVDEVWCNSAYVRDVYLESGIPES